MVGVDEKSSKRQVRVLCIAGMVLWRATRMIPTVKGVPFGGVLFSNVAEERIFVQDVGGKEGLAATVDAAGYECFAQEVVHLQVVLRCGG